MNSPQPSPKRSALPAIWALVIEDMRTRDRIGQKKYGTPLQPYNGRDALIDAYQEALDLTVYLRQVIFERDGITTNNPPVATVRKREKWKTLKLPNPNTNIPEKVRVHIGSEVVREAFSFIHKCTSAAFVGENENGWVFSCNGADKDADTNEVYGHYFIALPATV